MGTSLRLVSGGQTLVLCGTQRAQLDPIWVKSYSLGYPTPRVVANSYAGQSGKNDLTSFHDDRLVTLDLMIPGDGTLAGREAIFSQLCAMCHPANRPKLYIQKSSYGGVERVMTLRADPLTNSVTNIAASYYEVTLQFSCPSGLIDDLNTSSGSVPVVNIAVGYGVPAGPSAPNGVGTNIVTTGLSLPPGGSNPIGVGQNIRAFGTGFSLTAAASTGTTVINNTGSVPTSPHFYIYGQSTNPIIRNDTVGKLLQFNARGGMTIPSGQFLDVDVAKHTVFMNSDPSASYYKNINWTTSAWWDLLPGVNNIAYGGTNLDGLAQLLITYIRHWI